MFDAGGNRVGGEFTVNTQTDGSQTLPVAAGLPGGGFVVSWQDGNAARGDLSGSSIKAQIFDAAGSPVGPEFVVNTETAFNQLTPSIASRSDGSFVIA